MVKQADLEDVYLNLLGLSKKREVEGGADTDIEFTVFLSSDRHFYTVDFAVSQSDYTLQKVLLRRSLFLNFNPALMKITTFPAHHLTNNPNWPDFWLFQTTTEF